MDGHLTPRHLSRRDLAFLLHEWLGVAALSARPRYADHSRETFDAALETYERVATECFAPHYRAADVDEPRLVDGEVKTHPAIAPALRAFNEAGLMAATQPVEQGGMQLPYVVERAGMAWLFAANVATAGYPMLTIANANLLLAYAAPELVERYVPDMLAGKVFGTMCLSEPQAGSSLADVITRALPQADGTYRLHGQKMWISGGDHDLAGNIVHLVLAKVPVAEGGLPPGTAGLSLFLVPKWLPAVGASGPRRNDVMVAGLNHKLGYRGTSNCVLNFGAGLHQPDGAAGAVAWRVGAEGQGLACMFHMMNEARIGVGTGAVALGYAGYLDALRYARERHQGRPLGDRRLREPPVPILQHADVRRMLLQQKAWVEGGLALVLYCARLVDEVATGDELERERASQLLDLLTPVAKSWPSQWCLAANDLAIQVHGGYGYTRDFPVEQRWRDNRLNAIHEGTHGIQALDLLGRKIVQRGGFAFEALRAQLMATLEEMARDEEWKPEVAALRKVWEALADTTQRLLMVDDPALRLANASPYLEAFGHVVVGWLWLEQARVARQALAATAASTMDRDFYAGKLQAARFFLRWELPRIPAWLAVLDAPDRTVLDMRDDWF
ncbi:MAG: acyl-CoA dehydrogenase [Gammaproteobacteria bacterium]